MSLLKSFAGFLIGVIILLFIVWGGTELISLIFTIEDHEIKRMIRWAMIIIILILGAILRYKADLTRK